MSHPPHPRAAAPPLGGPPPAAPVFSTGDLPPEHRFEAWRAHVARLNHATAIAGAPPPMRDVASAAWQLGPLLLTRNVTPAMRLRRGPEHRRDGLDHWSLRVARDGGARARAAERSFIIPPRRLSLASFGLGFESEYEAGEWVTLIVPRDLDPVLSVGLAALGPGPVPGVPAQLLANHLLDLATLLPRATPGETAALAQGLRGLLRACLAGPIVPRAIAPADAQALLRERVRAVVREHIASARLGPERIAQLAGVSRSALYRAMEPEGGVAQFVLRERLRRVHDALGEPSLAGVPVSAVAERWGFYSAPSFHRAFRRAFGCTPREARAAALLGAPVPPRAAETDRAVGLADLVALLSAGPRLSRG